MFEQAKKEVISEEAHRELTIAEAALKWFRYSMNKMDKDEKILDKTIKFTNSMKNYYLSRELRRLKKDPVIPYKDLG